MKKITVLIMAMLLVFTAVPTAYAESTHKVNYKDLKATNWAYDSVSSMSEKGIIKGYPDGSFKPNNTVTYGEFIKMVIVASTNKDIGNSKKGNWSKSYYDKAVELKYFGNTDIKEEKLNSKIPRNNMSIIISGAIDYMAGGKVTYGANNGDGTSKENLAEIVYNNLNDISEKTLNVDTIIKVYASGIINGYEDNTFRPNNTLTRAESATIINRLIDEKKRIIPDLKIKKSVDEMLSISLDDGTTMAQYLGVNSAEQLRKKDPMVYYSFLSKETNNISEVITDTSGVKSLMFHCEYYKIVDMKDIGITSIKKVTNKFNEEAIEVLPGDDLTNVLLIKNKKVVCDLSSATGNGTEKATLFFPESTTYYNGAWENTKLMDFDYMGFWSSTGKTIFLVKKIW